MTDVVSQIGGTTAAQIARSVRDLIQSGALPAGTTLPAIRALAAHLGTNRNTVAAAYGRLGAAGLVEARWRAGTVVAGPPELAGEGSPAAEALVNLAHGNPAAEFLPDIGAWLGRGYRPTLYGAPAVSDDFEALGRGLLSPDVHSDHRILAAGGAVDAFERLLMTHLTRGDAVAVEHPCFLSSIGLLHVHGLRPAPVPVDGHGLLPDQLDEALRSGARAVIITPRAHNPTGASLDSARAHQLRSVLKHHPDVFVIEDDHFSAVSSQPYLRATPESTVRWALIRSVSKFLGPDLRVAIAAADPITAYQLERRLGAATTWVSHILQHLTVALLEDPATRELLTTARDSYSARSHALVNALTVRDIDVQQNVDGLNVWVPLTADEQSIVDDLAQLGWAVRPGSDFAVATDTANAIRVTTSTMTADVTDAFASDLQQLLQRGHH